MGYGKIYAVITERSMTVGERTERLFGTIERELCVKKGDIMAKNRREDVLEARQIMQYIMWKNLCMAHGQIAKVFKMDRTSIIHSTNKMNDMLRLRDESITRKYKKVTKKFIL